MKKLSELLDNNDRQAIRAPIDRARTFPRHAFTDTDFYEYEVAHVLTQSWFAVGFSTAVSNKGDIKPLTVINIPILLIRGDDGVARAFHNVCPYDGCEVCMEPLTGSDFIITPYHGWKYDLNGRLIEANYWDGSPDASSLDLSSLDADLVEIPCTEWCNTLFVHLGKNPEPFEEQYASVLDHFRNIDVERIEIGTNRDDKPIVHSLTIHSNWKTVYENYSPNVYHESFVHEMYRKSPYSPRVDDKGQKTYTEINDPSGFLGLCYDNSIGDSLYGATQLPKIRNRDGSHNTINTIANVFPNWVTTFLGDAVRISIFLPEGPETGTQWVATMFDRDGATDAALTKDRNQSARKGIMARKEDNVICESIQRARHSPGVTNQFYSPFWDAMHYTLTNLILDKLEQAEAEKN